MSQRYEVEKCAKRPADAFPRRASGTGRSQARGRDNTGRALTNDPNVDHDLSEVGSSNWRLQEFSKSVLLPTC